MDSNPRSRLSAAKTDASAIAEPHATDYFWFELGTDIAKESRHGDRRRHHSVRKALTSLVRSQGYVAMEFECAEDLLKSKRRRMVCPV
jgi:hypothetical protein